MKTLLVLVVVATLIFAGCAGKPADAMAEKNKSGDSMENKSGPAMAVSAKYAPFSKASFDQAKAEGKVIFLEFYANWCPICAAQASELEAAFRDIQDPRIAAFRVNFKDSDTDADEQALARQFQIAYQHTHVILGSNGTVAWRSQETLTREDVKAELARVS